MSLRSPTLFKWTLRWYFIVQRRETGITCLHLLHVPTFQQSTFHLLVPNLCKCQLTWNCHPTSISQTNHRHPVAHLSDRWSTGPQVHQSYWKLWPCGTCVPVSCGSGSQSQLSEEQVSSELFQGTFCRTMCDLPIPRYDDTTDTLGEGLPNLTFDTRSQPPKLKPT